MTETNRSQSFFIATQLGIQMDCESTVVAANFSKNAANALYNLEKNKCTREEKIFIIQFNSLHAQISEYSRDF